MPICTLCKESIDYNKDINVEKVKCVVCRASCHTNCLSITDMDIKFMKKEKIQWKCNACVSVYCVILLEYVI